jgi:hypothetical protein
MHWSSQSMPRQIKGLDHHVWVFIPRVTWCVFSHQSKWSLTLSNICWIVAIVALKTLLFPSVHIIEMQHSQTSCMNERRALTPPTEWINWRKWSCNETGSTDDTTIHDQTKPHKEAKTGQDRNKCWAISNPPHQSHTIGSREKWCYTAPNYLSSVPDCAVTARPKQRPSRVNCLPN